MHRIDWIGSQLAARPAVTERLFQDGWGDLSVVMDDLGRIPAISGRQFEQKNPRLRNGYTITDLRFPSPYGLLPTASQTGYVRLIEPPHPERVVLLMAAFNEHGYETRQAIGQYLLRRNVAVAILENPFYGLRRPSDGQPLRTAANLLSMGVGAVWDGLEVLAWLRARRSWTVGVAGYSMGANTAALVTCASRIPIACAALAASHSPGPVFTKGALKASVDWAALGGESAVDRLGKVFGQATVLRFDPPPHTAAAVILGIRGDGYVLPEATMALANHWPGSELEWSKGGHATVLWTHKRRLADLIVRSFDRLDDLTGAARALQP